ncbi:MAG: peptidylprolyl isomerase [Bacteroidota bacterium]
MKNLLLLMFVPLTLFAQSEQQIRIHQDKRIEQSQELYTYLRSDNERERELALLAIANIQDTAAVDAVAPLLTDEVPKVRSMAAFALGMINKPRCATLLFRRLSVEREEKCVADILNAIGLCGTQDDLKKMVVQAEDYPEEWRSWLALSIARFANRKIKDITATKFAATLLNDNATVINATYALMRIGDTTVIRNNRIRLIEQLGNSSAIVRMWSASALSVLKDDETIQALTRTAEQDKDWRVRVNAIRALRSKPSSRMTVLKAINDKNEHAALSAVASYDQITADETVIADSSIMFELLRSTVTPVSVKEDIRILLAKKMGERAIPLIGPWKNENPYIAAQRVRAFGATGSEKSVPLIREAILQSGSSSAIVTIAGIESYQSIAQHSNEQVKKDFLKTAILMFARNDAGISYTSSVAFQDTAFSADIRKIYLSALVTAYNNMKAPADLEPMVELLKVFGEIGDSSALPSIENALTAQDNVIRRSAEKAYTAITDEEPPTGSVSSAESYKPFYSMQDLPLLEQYKGAEITTSRGKIRITFEKEAAPFTVLNFIKLAKQKFYDGLSFHRVVSNFVIQGGDPLGNGSGGPNYSIRTEVHPNARFKSGGVGMASAGKDTEGSQWFITHCPTPHLDYRYTVFGYTPDAKVIDQIMIGDKIERIVLF